MTMSGGGGSRRDCHCRIADEELLIVGILSSPATAEDLGEGPLELATCAGVDEGIKAAVAVAQPKAEREERLGDAASGAQRLCKSNKKEQKPMWTLFLSNKERRRRRCRMFN